MDPISHLALGRALAAWGEGRAPADRRDAGPRGDRRTVAAFLLGSIAPDIDVALVPWGWDRYLAAHEYLTHSIAGTLASAALAALVIVLVTRSRRGVPRLVLSAWAGSALGHAALDLVSGGTVRPFWPVLDTRWTLPLVAMGDPILAVPLWLFFVSSAIWRRHAGMLARVAVAVSLLVLAAKGVSLGVASRLVARHAELRGPAAIEAEWGSFSRWKAFDRHGDLVRGWAVDAQAGTVRLRLERRGPRDAPEARASRALETVRNFHQVHALGFPQIVQDGQKTTVLWSDIRSCRESVCDLWFGGTFDAKHRPLEQIVIVGDFKQTRAP